MVTPYRFYKHPDHVINSKAEPLLEPQQSTTATKIIGSSSLSNSWKWLKSVFTFKPRQSSLLQDSSYTSLSGDDDLTSKKDARQ